MQGVQDVIVGQVCKEGDKICRDDTIKLYASSVYELQKFIGGIYTEIGPFAGISKYFGTVSTKEGSKVFNYFVLEHIKGLNNSFE